MTNGHHHQPHSALFHDAHGSHSAPNTRHKVLPRNKRGRNEKGRSVFVASARLLDFLKKFLEIGASSMFSFENSTLACFFFCVRLGLMFL